MKIQLTPKELKKINEGEKKRLQQKRKNLLLVREKEIKEMGKLYKAKVADSKLVNAKRLLDLRDTNEATLANETKNLEQKLKKYQDAVDDMKNVLDNEKKNIVEKHKDDLNTIMQNNADMMNHKVEETYAKNRELDHKIGSEVVNAQLQAQRRIDQSKIDTSNQVNEALRRNELKLKSTQVDKTIAQRRAELERRKANRLVSERKAHLRHLNKLNILKEQSIKDKHKNELDRIDQQNSSVLSSRQKMFEKKYDIQTKNHQEVMDRIQKVFKQEIEDISKKHAEYKKNVSDKSTTDFYRVNKLDPTVINQEKDCLVSVKVPEYEKDNINLTADGRKVKITLSRRYEDSIKKEDGSRDQTKRSEILTKSFQAPNLLKANKMTRKYENGVLTFKIPHA